MSASEAKQQKELSNEQFDSTTKISLLVFFAYFSTGFKYTIITIIKTEIIPRHNNSTPTLYLQLSVVLYLLDFCWLMLSVLFCELYIKNSDRSYYTEK